MNLTDSMPGGGSGPGDRLKANQERRKRKEALVTLRDSYSDGQAALDEIFERKRMRGRWPTSAIAWG